MPLFLCHQHGIFGLQVLDGREFPDALVIEKLLCRLIKCDLTFMLRKKLLGVTGLPQQLQQSFKTFGLLCQRIINGSANPLTVGGLFLIAQPFIIIIEVPPYTAAAFFLHGTSAHIASASVNPFLSGLHTV